MSDANGVEPRILERPEHPISRKNISPNTLKVLYRLHQHGYKAFLVGGGVRDLMLGRAPKDFDVSTDARPHEIRKLFRNSRIIGRRFRLAHVFFQGEVVEVSTFRREPDPDEQESGDDELLITSDNTFGTPRQDAFRRDLTINALFYNIADFTVLDYVGGIEDLEARTIRVIGDPDVRFQEDPVRMLRACEFAGRLGFELEERTQQSIARQRHELEKASPARLTEEVVQLLKCGHAARAMGWMLDVGLTEVLMPEAYDTVAAGERGLGDFEGILPQLDALVADGRKISDAALLAAFLLPRVEVRRHDVEAVGGRPLSRAAVEQLIREEVAPFFERFTLSRVRSQEVVWALVGFERLCEPRWSPKARLALARKPYFDDALLLFEVLVGATGEGHEVLDEWRKTAEIRGEQKLGEVPRKPAAGRRRRRRRRRR